MQTTLIVASKQSHKLIISPVSKTTLTINTTIVNIDEITITLDNTVIFVTNRVNTIASVSAFPACLLALPTVQLVAFDSIGFGNDTDLQVKELDGARRDGLGSNMIGRVIIFFDCANIAAIFNNFEHSK